MDNIEDYWEGDGPALPDTTAPYHNLAVYGADLLDVLLLDADRIAERLRKPSQDDLLHQTVDRDNDRAWRVVLESCRAPGGEARTVIEAASAMGEEGLEGDGGGPGIETLVVALGANNALGTIVHLKARWTPDDYLRQPPADRLDSKGGFNIWQPEHFAAEWAQLVEEIEPIKARHVILATVPHVTIAPIARGCGGKVVQGSRYFPFYTRPWITDDDFDKTQDEHLTEDDARAIDSAIDGYNATIVESVRAARQRGRDWYVLDLAGLLDSLASRRYLEDPAARPAWWRAYDLPAELKALTPVPNTRFFRSGPEGRTDGGLISLDGVHPTTTGYGIIRARLSESCVTMPRSGSSPRTALSDYQTLSTSTSAGCSPPTACSADHPVRCHRRCR